ncbi:hypothetical protein OH540_09290 [Streptomyces sp. BPPL-273]|uniref:hypothetical protein n=1 Tax=Streptomyces sp. BPPL-273 TaxID=2987533 RepID=UPI0024AF8913|nr:hypothetical protein [Streptomyces sp. BPPL-273]WHM30215.1 hypothetical protein OH540_09290 [Streptomyces sp. BPPL-273]
MMTTLGTCPVCHRQYTLTEEGLLPHHLEKAVNSQKTSPPCEGAGQSPAKK